jgi:hypothetical protein
LIRLTTFFAERRRALGRAGSFGLGDMDLRMEGAAARCRTSRGSQGARWALALASLAAASCAIDGADACGAHQVYKTGGTIVDYQVCVCDEAHGYVFDQQRGYGCKSCPAGHQAVDGECVAPTPDAGSQREDASADAMTASAPTGVGESCKTDADCAKYDATYCEALSLHVCLVDKCAKGENACGADTGCCDYSALLAGFSLCIPNDQLDNGNCPMGGKKVQP